MILYMIKKIFWIVLLCSFYVLIENFFYLALNSTVSIKFSDKQQKVIRNSSVVVVSKNKKGSGIITKIDNKYVVITNAHVCAFNDYIDIVEGKEKPKMSRRFNVYSKYYESNAILIKYDIYQDLCMLGLATTPKSHLEIAKKETDTMEEVFLTTHHPETGKYMLKAARFLGRDLLRNLWTKTHLDSVLISTKVIAGMSGSAIINKLGKIVFIVWGRNLAHKNRGFAVGYRALKKFTESL